MTRSGIILILVGLGIAVLGTLQFELVVRLSDDPTINPVGNGILMWLSWAVAGVLLAVGAVLALIGRLTGNPPLESSSVPFARRAQVFLDSYATPWSSLGNTL